ncbi:efflux RND transporter permease subunit [Spirosoma luteum]|uniref:efflux RND transporter permease subunit n=1 Tax=Spirosoma luteum TaxID=431553 RepID=UPI000380DB93|nr:efflux RND transporter permease subunit [Spirosoma luteum]
MEKRKTNLIEKAMKYRQIVFILIVLSAFFGVFALWKMPRNEFPEFIIRQGVIIGVYQGATSHQVEDHLTDKVENYLFSFQEVNRDKTYSISKEGLMVIMVEVNTNVKDPDAFWDKLKFGLNDLKRQLPQQVIALNADNDFGNTSAILLNVQSEQRNFKELEHYVNVIEAELRQIKSVSKVKHYGLQQEQISIYINPDKLATYGVRPASVLAALQMEGSVNYAGAVNSEQLVMPIHVPANYTSENDIARQIIYTDPAGNIIRLKDIATIKREFIAPDSYIKNNGKISLLISLEMQRGNNIVDFGKEVDETLQQINQHLPQDINITKTADLPAVVNHSIQHFLREFLIAVCGVIVVVMLMLPFRVASVAGATIPVIIFISIGILYLLGIDLNTVSLAGLIVVLGMVVDDAIVVIDNHLEKLDHGETPWNAAWKSATELFIPVLTATLSIIITFVPALFFLKGMIGDFVYALPVTIGVALTVSLAVAYFVVPYISFSFIKKGIKKVEVKQKKNSLFNHLQKGFDASLEKAFQKSKVTVAIGFASFFIGLLLFAIMPRQLFPKVERNQFAVEIYLPEGSTLKQTALVTDSLSQMLLADERVVNVGSFFGTGSPRFHTTYAPNFPSKNYAQLVVNTTTEESAVALMGEYEKQKRNYFPDAYIRVKQLDLLPTTAPIEVRISGNNIDSIKRVAEKVQAVMKGNDDIIWARTDYLNPLQGVRVEVNDEVSNRLGFTKGMVATSLATGFSGLPVGTVWEGDYPVNVKLINEPERRNSFDDIENQMVTSPLMGTTVPVRQLATITNDWSEGQIIRRNGIRTITVRADIKREALAYKILDDIKPDIEAIKMGEGNIISYGGELENEYENYVPLSKALATSIVLIFFILLFQFKSSRLVLLIMTTIPLSIFGAAVGLLVTGYPFGLTVFLGLMSLIGIVVRNGIILIDYAEELRRSHQLDIQQAAMAAAKRRMRPIFLTSAAGAVGVVPMMVSGSSLWGPLATVIFFGLLFSMIFSLYVLPTMYHLFLKKTRHSITQNTN